MNIKLTLIIIVSLFSYSIANGQMRGKKIVISGIVCDSLQKPVPGASIFVDNKETPYVTNKKGYYKIKVKPDARKILIFSTLNRVNETTIDGRTTINIFLSGSSKMQPDNIIKNTKDEIVDVGFGLRNKKEMTSGRASLGNKRSSSYSSIYDMIRIELPGVYVREKSVYLQGKSSFDGSSECLIVVDGIIAMSIDDVLPADVESIQVLKGPATAVYGMRGANGVIFIRTFRGSDKK